MVNVQKFINKGFYCLVSWQRKMMAVRKGVGISSAASMQGTTVMVYTSTFGAEEEELTGPSNKKKAYNNDNNN